MHLSMYLYEFITHFGVSDSEVIFDQLAVLHQFRHDSVCADLRVVRRFGLVSSDNRISEDDQGDISTSDLHYNQSCFTGI